MSFIAAATAVSPASTATTATPAEPPATPLSTAALSRAALDNIAEMFDARIAARDATGIVDLARSCIGVLGQFPQEARLPLILNITQAAQATGDRAVLERLRTDYKATVEKITPLEEIFNFSKPAWDAYRAGSLPKALKILDDRLAVLGDQNPMCWRVLVDAKVRLLEEAKGFKAAETAGRCELMKILKAGNNLQEPWPEAAVEIALVLAQISFKYQQVDAAERWYQFGINAAEVALKKPENYPEIIRAYEQFKEMRS